MQNANEKEVWKEYPLNFEFDGHYRIEVSNKGNIMTFNSLHPEGKILNCAIQSGFKCLRATLRRKRSEKDQTKIDEIQTKIDELNFQIKEIGNTTEELFKKKNLREERDLLINKRAKLNNHLNKKYRIYFCLLIHRAVAELFLEKPEYEDQKFIIHKDFDKLNNKVDNLAWANQELLNSRSTQHPKNVLYQFKMRFMDEKPVVKYSKLTESEVLVIKKRLKKGYSLRRLAKQFGVSDMQIYRIKTGENWGHVKLLEDIAVNKKK